MKERMVPAQQLSDAGEDLARLAAAKDAEIAALKADNESLTATQAQAIYDRDLSWRHIADRDAEIALLKAELDAATATFDDEQAAHQDTLRLWQQAKAEIVAITEQRDRAMKVVEAARDLLANEKGDWVLSDRLTTALAALDAEAVAETALSLSETPEA